MTDVALATAAEEPSPKLAPWSLSRGNFVHVHWVSSRLRVVETQGVIRDVRGDQVYITATKSTSMEKATVIHIERVKHVDVILEGEEGKDARKKAWEIIKQAAGCINRRSEWDPDGFFESMNQLALIFPQISKRGV